MCNCAVILKLARGDADRSQSANPHLCQSILSLYYKIFSNLYFRIRSRICLRVSGLEVRRNSRIQRFGPTRGVEISSAASTLPPQKQSVCKPKPKPNWMADHTHTLPFKPATAPFTSSFLFWASHQNLYLENGDHTTRH